MFTIKKRSVIFMPVHSWKAMYKRLKNGKILYVKSFYNNIVEITEDVRLARPIYSFDEIEQLESFGFSVKKVY